MIKGQCLCGGVQYQYDGEITELAVCHCDQCKRAQGTAFVTNAPVDTKHFSLLTGGELLTEYFSSPNKKRVFCKTCGSPIYSQRTDMPEKIRLRAGSITQGLIPSPSYQIYCESKAQWFKIGEGEPEYAQMPSSR